MADTVLHLGEPGGLEQVAERELCSGSEEDLRLVEGLKAGRAEAYETLIAAYQRPVYNLVCRLLGDSEDACDVVQEVFLKVFRKVAAFRRDSSLKTWIYRVSVNEAHNYRRWHSRHCKQEVVGLDGPTGDSPGYSRRLPDPGRSPYDCAAASERQALIQAALGRLKSSFRAAVVLRDVEELSYEEIAEILRIPLGTVKSRILRGREALRKDLAGRLEPVPAMGWTPQTAE